MTSILPGTTYLFFAKIIMKRHCLMVLCVLGFMLPGRLYALSEVQEHALRPIVLALASLGGIALVVKSIHLSPGCDDGYNLVCCPVGTLEHCAGSHSTQMPCGANENLMCYQRLHNKYSFEDAVYVPTTVLGAVLVGVFLVGLGAIGVAIARE